MPSAESYHVKNWNEFQHYRDRNPPWIKLHKKIIDDFEFQSLPVASKALAPMLWIIASEHDDPTSGIITGPDAQIAFRLHMSLKDFQVAMKPLINSKFFAIASNVLAERYQDATPETETYREETEIEKRKNTKKEKFKLPDDIPEQDWYDYLEMRDKIRKPMTDKAKEMAVKQLYAFRDQGYEIPAVIQQSVFSSWQGLFAVRGVTPIPPSAQKAPIDAKELGMEGEGLKKVFEHLQQRFGDGVFRSWMHPIRIKEKNCATITLMVPTNFMREWINSHYSADMAVAFRSVWPELKNIEWAVAEKA